jgi:transcriptional regulator with XRE-family HTH domain
MIISTSSSPVIMGRRLRYLRNLARLTIIDFATIAGVSNPSISYWENGQINHPIKSKSMTKVIDGFNKVGIDVTERWLRTGEGELPSFRGSVIHLEERDIEPIATRRNPLGEDQPLDLKLQLNAILPAEMKLFVAIELSVVAKVDHCQLAPFINKGDLVGGIWQQASLIIEPTICIFKRNNQLEVAGIKRSKKPEKFDIFYHVQLPEIPKPSRPSRKRNRGASLPNEPISTEASADSEENKLLPLETGVALYKVAPVFRMWRSIV